MPHPILDFTQEFFLQLNLHSCIADLSADPEGIPQPDLGLRTSLLGRAADPSALYARLLPDEPLTGDDPHVILFYTDIYQCHYVCIRLTGDSKPILFLAGPWLTERQSIASIQDRCARLSIPMEQVRFLSAWYSTLPLMDEDIFLDPYMESLERALFPSEPFILRRKIEEDAPAEVYSTGTGLPRNEDTMRLLERRYRLEERMMNAIARGDEEEAQRCLSDKVFSAMEDRTQSPLRSKKNGSIVLNTLCRKGAQRGGVHPVDLDDISRRFSIRIENMRTTEEYPAMARDMLRRYCRLVQTHSLAEYSGIIGSVVTYIRCSLGDSTLTLTRIAEHFSLNKSYLATLFKKETGETITAYINRLRVDQAIFLLNTTEDPIQDIAAACGLPDPNWFTRLFVREKGMTPSAYRRMVSREGRKGT